VAHSATIYSFDIELSDVDRAVYERLALRVACQSSETQEYLVTRVLAYCLEFAEGISFGKGLAEPGEPAITVRDLTGALRVWVEIGAPDAARLHRASMSAPRVVVYTHKNPTQVLQQLAGERIHRSETVEVYSFDRGMLGQLVARLSRRTAIAVSVSDAHLYITIDGETLSGAVTRHTIAGG
jgi:uncharacterized protein YaeQ